MAAFPDLSQAYWRQIGRQAKRRHRSTPSMSGISVYSPSLFTGDRYLRLVPRDIVQRVTMSVTNLM